MLVQSERLANQPADAIALDAPAGSTNRNGKS